MNQPDKATQKSIIENTLKSLENECYSLSTSAEAFKTVGLTERAESFAKQLADAMKLHAFYTTKLNELSE